MLREVHAFFSPPSSNQLAIDALSLELVKPVAKLGALMENCCDIARAIIEFFVSNCNPRDMLSILCEAVDEPVASNGLVYFVLLFKELAKVLVLIHRRHTEQVKVALPAVLQVMNAAIPEYDEEHGKIIIDMFNAALGIGNAIQEMCKKMVNQKNEELCSVLSLYSLQNIHFFQSDVDEDADLLKCFSFAMDGASLAVIWTYMDDLISKYAEAELESALKDVKGNHTRMWQAINILRYVFSSTHYPWVLKSNGLDLLLSIANESCIEEINDHVDASSSGPEIFATLKAIESVMISAPDALMRKKAFAALKQATLKFYQVVSMVPSSQRFDILQALVQNSIFPSLTAILLDLVKDEVLRESRQADQNFIESDQLQDGREWPPPWFCHALELVGLILKPPEGGPPCLPDHGEQVLSALNLLRFVLIIDSRGSRSRKMFDKETMRKVYSEWLIPLRPIVAGIQSESEEDGSDAANHIMCSLNPVQLDASGSAPASSRSGDGLLTPRVSALLLHSLIADRSAIRTGRRLLSRLLAAHPLHTAAEAVADAASIASSDFLIHTLITCPAPASLYRAADAFRVLSSRGASPSIKTCNAFLEALARAGQLDAARKVFDEMRENRNIALNEYSYTAMIKALCKAGKLDAGFEMLAELWRAGLQPTVVTYNVLMDALCKSGRVDEAFRLKGRMEEGGVTPSVVTFGILINGLARGERFGEVGMVLREMERFGISPNEIIYNELIGWHCRKGHCSEALRLFDEMVSKEMKPTAVTYNLIAKALCKEGEMERAERILEDMLSNGMTVHCGLFNTVVAWLIQRTGRLESVVSIMNEMVTRGMRPNDPLMTACMRELCKGGKHQEAVGIWFKILNKGLGVNLATSNALIHGLCGGKYMKEATRVLQTMLNKGIELDSITYNIMIQGCCKDSKMEEAIKLRYDMTRRGFKPDLFTFNTLLHAYCNLGKMEETFHLLDQMKNEGLQPDIVTYGTIIDGYCKAKDIHKAKECLNELMNHGLKPNVVIYNALIGGYGRIGNISGAVDTLESMKSKGIQPTNVTYCSLMHWMCHAGLVEEAKTIFTQARENNFDLGVIGYTIMIHGYCKLGKMGEAVTYFEEMRSRGISPNKFTYTTMMYAFSKSGNSEEASKLFDEMVSSGIILDNISYDTLIARCSEVNSLDKDIGVPAELSSGGLTKDDCLYKILANGINAPWCQKEAASSAE
uniref:Uncharacterized protein n=1 Tax=Oryza brachyantha TaxID=4533 RepID=J3MRW2_ORYBR